jgi:hypothetical protein
VLLVLRTRLGRSLSASSNRSERWH